MYTKYKLPSPLKLALPASWQACILLYLAKGDSFCNRLFYREFHICTMSGLLIKQGIHDFFQVQSPTPHEDSLSNFDFRALPTTLCGKFKYIFPGQSCCVNQCYRSHQINNIIKLIVKAICRKRPASSLQLYSAPFHFLDVNHKNKA